jgi:Uma2 family endonuclease
MTTHLHLTPQDQGRPLSLEEFEHASSQEGYLYELIEGKLEVSPLPNFPHDFIRKWLERRLDDYSDQHPEILAHVQAPARVFVPGRSAATTPESDLAGYADFPEAPDIEELNWQDYSPILVAEILSEDTADKDRVRNLDLYLQVASIREYWIFDPQTDANHPSLTVYRRRGQHWQRPIEIAGGDSYTTRLLPEFQLTLTVTKSRRRRGNGAPPSA